MDELFTRLLVSVPRELLWIVGSVALLWKPISKPIETKIDDWLNHKQRLKRNLERLDLDIEKTETPLAKEGLIYKRERLVIHEHFGIDVPLDVSAAWLTISEVKRSVTQKRLPLARLKMLNNYLAVSEKTGQPEIRIHWTDIVSAIGNGLATILLFLGIIGLGWLTTVLLIGTSGLSFVLMVVAIPIVFSLNQNADALLAFLYASFWAQREVNAILTTQNAMNQVSNERKEEHSFSAEPT